MRNAVVALTLGGMLLQTGGASAARILALGDSYTIGESVPSAERWPTQLTERLKAEGIRLEAPQYIARTGWTTDELSAAIDSEQPVGPYPLVTLLIGVNDQYRGRPAAEYAAPFTQLLQRAIAYAGGQAQHVLVLSIPDWSVTPFAAASGRDRARIAAEIDAYNAHNAKLSRELGVHWVDITAGTREASTRPELLAEDGLHPSAVDYARWADAALPAARTALQALRQTRQGR